MDNSSVMFFAGLILGAIVGFLGAILLLWVATHYQELDDQYYNDKDDLLQ